MRTHTAIVADHTKETPPFYSGMLLPDGFISGAVFGTTGATPEEVMEQLIARFKSDASYQAGDVLVNHLGQQVAVKGRPI